MRSAAGTQYLAGREQGGAARHHVIDQHDASLADLCGAERLQCERPAQVAQAFSAREAALRGGFPDPQQQGRIRFAWRQSPCEFVRLVESALSQPRRCERHRQHQIRVFQFGLHPVCAAEQGRKWPRPPSVAPELELRDAFRPWPSVRTGRKAGVEWRRIPNALVALRHPAGQLQRTTGHAAQSGRGEACNARVTRAGPATHGRPRIGSGVG